MNELVLPSNGKNESLSGNQGHSCNSRTIPFMFLPEETPMDDLPLQQVDVEPIFNFDDALLSKLYTEEEMVNPLIESDNGLVLAMTGMNNHMSTDHGSTCSVSDMSLLDLPSVPSFNDLPPSNKNAIATEDFHLSSPFETMGPLPCRTGTQMLEENHFPVAKPLSGNYAADTLVSMNDARHDINGFLTQAVSLTQKVFWANDTQAQSDTQPLSTLPCVLPMYPSQTMVTSLQQMLSASQTQYQPLFSTSPMSNYTEPLVKVVAPVITKDTVAQTGLASVSLSMATGNSVMAQRSISADRPSATTETGILPTKKKNAPRLYECPTCFKVFDRAYNRKMHMTTHEAIEKRLRPFKCPWPECGKQFARKHDMNRHYLGVHLKARKTSKISNDQKEKECNSVVIPPEQ